MSFSNFAMFAGKEACYGALVSSALRLAGEETIMDCALNERCIAVQTTRGVGMAFLPASAWERAVSRGLHRSADALRARPLTEVIPRYLEGDPLWTVIALAAMNSLFIDCGEADSGDWFAGLTVKKVGMIGDLRPFANRTALAGCEQAVFELLPIPGTYGPEDAPLLLPSCDLILITSAVFSNKTLHYYLPHIADSARAYIFGHGTPLADPLSERFILASNRVLDPEAVFQNLKEGKGIRELKPFMGKVIRNRALRPQIFSPAFTVAPPTGTGVAFPARQGTDAASWHVRDDTAKEVACPGSVNTPENDI